MFFSQTLDLVALTFPELSQADQYLRFQRVVHFFFLKKSFDKKAPKTFGNEAKCKIGLFALCKNYITILLLRLD